MPYLGRNPDKGNFSDLNGAKLILDADADTSITADTDDQIDIEISGANDFKFSANAFNVLSGSTLTIDSGATITNSGTASGFGSNVPTSADGQALGSASLEWSDLYLADGGIIYFGADQEVSLTHNHNTSLTCNLMIAATTFEPTGDTAAGDNSALGYTSVLGAILTGQGSTNDVTLVNDADATVLSIPTGTTNVTVVGDVTTGGRVNGFIIDQFQAVGNAQLNVTGDGTNYTVLFAGTELYDADGVFASPNYTASAAGKAHLNFQIQMGPYLSDHTRMLVKLRTSNRDYTSDDVNAYTLTSGAASSGYQRWCGSFICDMDASDTAYMQMYCDGGSKTLDVGAATDCRYMGYLIKD